MPDRLLTRAEVEERVGLKRSSIYRGMRAGQFPVPIKVGSRAVRWVLSEVELWLAERPRATGDGPPRGTHSGRRMGSEGRIRND